MTQDQAKNQAKNIPITEYLDTVAAKKGAHYICPLCGSGTGPNGSPAGSVDRRTNKYTCFSCNTGSLDIFDLVGRVENLDKPAAFERVYAMFNIHTDGIQSTTAAQDFDISIAPEPSPDPHAKARIMEYVDSSRDALKKSLVGVNYLQHRGLTLETMERFKLGYDPEEKRIIIPYNPEGSYYIGRSVIKDVPDKKKHYKPTTEEAGPEPLFNGGALYTSGDHPVFIVEAPLCAISITQAGGHAVAIGGIGTQKLISQVKARKPEAPLILSLDNDNTGIARAQVLGTELDSLGIIHYSLNIAGAYKDPNEALQIEPEAFTERVQSARDQILSIQEMEREAVRQEYAKTSAAAHLEAFKNGIKESVNTPYISTGFNNLDVPLDGGLYEGLYIIGAISSLGKTTFTMQLGDQMAQAGHDVLIFSLEMGRSELMAKSISRQTLINLSQGQKLDAAKSTREITTGKKWQYYSDQDIEQIHQAMNDYGQYAGRIWIHEGIGDIGVKKIRETIENHIKLLGSKPIVIIDYLQILEPYDMKASDKQNTDKAVTELKRITRDHKLPIIAISSFNRENYKMPVSMASFKESGAIEYSSDVLIGLQLKGIEEMGKAVKDFNVDEAKNKDPREVELKILKNRNGRTGDTICFDYYAKYNYFTERY